MIDVDLLLASWRDARVNELEGWKIDALKTRVEDIGCAPMDPKVSSSLTARVADRELELILGSDQLAELKRMKAEAFGEPTDKAKPVRPLSHYDIRSSSGWYIYEVILPAFLEHFFDKNADYGDQHRTGLGVRAEFVGIHRKVAKLKKAVWDEEELVGEQVEELLYDLIGTALLMLDLLNEPLADPREPAFD